MAERNQRTLKNPCTIEGVGLHTGQAVRLEIRPADPDSGVVFVRTDLEDEDPIPAHLSAVDANPRRTALRNGNAEVHTVEHFFAALVAARIDNVEVHLDGSEMPGLDGSARPFLEALDAAGIQEQKAPRPTYRVKDPISVHVGDSTLSIAPHEKDVLSVSYTLDFPDQPLGSQFLQMDVDPDVIREHLASARTFVLAHEADALREQGLGQGADYSNTLVMRDDGTPVENELRFADELVRHKVLDLCGDLFLAGVDLIGAVQATKSGHAANQMLVKELIERIEEQENESEAAWTGMEIKEVLNLLPHRYPFLLIDRVLKLEGYRRAVGIKNVTINEPFFQGHFPEQPIMPGVLILEAMAQLAGLLLLRRLENTGKLAVLWSIDKVKLRRAVVPGDQLRIEIEATKVRSSMGQGKAVAKVGGHKVAEAVLTFTLVDAD